MSIIRIGLGILYTGVVIYGEIDVMFQEIVEISYETVSFIVENRGEDESGEDLKI